MRITEEITAEYVESEIRYIERLKNAEEGYEFAFLWAITEGIKLLKLLKQAIEEDDKNIHVRPNI